jgi:hypothetical protein
MCVNGAGPTSAREQPTQIIHEMSSGKMSFASPCRPRAVLDDQENQHN